MLGIGDGTPTGWGCCTPPSVAAEKASLYKVKPEGYLFSKVFSLEIYLCYVSMRA
jgi:hypothetical protein